MRNVAIFLPSRSSNVSGDLDGEGCGAREQVASWLVHVLSKCTDQIHVFTNQTEPIHYFEGMASVHYVEQEMAAPMLSTYEWDLLLTFDFPAVATLPDIKKTVKKIVLVQNYLGVPPEGATDPETIKLIDAFVYPSEWAAKVCSEMNGYDYDKAVVIPYAADQRFFHPRKNEIPRSRETYEFIYANQAESGLPGLLKMWPQILEKLPGSMLTVATPVEEFVQQIQWSHQLQAELALDMKELISQPGVKYVGRQGRAKLAQYMRDSDALLFPADPLAPSEIGSLPMIQAIASNCRPIFYDVDALGELYDKNGLGFKVEPGHMLAPLDSLLNSSYDGAGILKRIGRDADSVAQDWRDFLADA